MKDQLECYICAENNARFCKICQRNYCERCHADEMKSMEEFGEFLTPHQYYEMEFLGVVTA